MPNHLARETSLYLRQHAANPVDWHPWGEPALALARRLDRPILLSIGYSACHWCHVMAHESFEDEATAALMNAHFVNIKVDREERPDLDQVYQTAHHLLTGKNGGWPLTVFLAPDQTPFFAGTYFPATARYSLPGFKELIPRVAAFYREHAGEFGAQGAALRDAFERTLPRHATRGVMSGAPLKAAREELVLSHDSVWGGFGGAPKFPHPASLEFCLRRYASDNDATALDMARLTLRKMADGGIHDQIGGGFYRYGVDRHWAIPHFEKMLYDNGPLLGLYSDAWTIGGEARFKEIAEGTAEWAVREMQSPQGGYYATLDADSEHEEGKFYVWTAEQVGALLSQPEYALLAPHYGLDRPANFEGRYWHFNVRESLADVALRQGLSEAEARRLLASARHKLFAARERRIRPGRDEKILVSWNALMIKGMARAARVFGRPDWLASAQAAAGFIRREMWRNGRLLAVHQEVARLDAYLDDYAFLLDAMLELLQGEFRSEDLDFARELADLLLEKFEDREQGGFYFTGHDHEPLIHRPKPGLDGATPAGNGVVAQVLQRLGHVLGEIRYLDAAERTLRLFYPALEHQPGGFKSLLFALEEHLVPPRIAVLRGPGHALAEWARAANDGYRPETLVFAVPNGMQGLPGVFDKPESRQVNAWVCQGVKCSRPIAELSEWQKTCKGDGFV